MLVREELARRRLSRQWLADEARVSLSTLEKALAGRRPFTLATVVRIEDALGTGLRGPASGQTATICSRPNHGCLCPARGAMAGGRSHLTLRPSFSEAGAVFAYLTLIAWDDLRRAHLSSSARPRAPTASMSRKASCPFPTFSGAIYLVTISEGPVPASLCSTGQTAAGLSGILLTLAAGKGAQLIPGGGADHAASDSAAAPTPRVGVIRKGDRCYDEDRDPRRPGHRQQLRIVSRKKKKRGGGGL